MTGKPKGQREEDHEGQEPHKWWKCLILRILRAVKRCFNCAEHEDKEPKTEHQINERMMARWTRRVGWFTFFLVLVGISTAIIFWRQLNAMEGQLDESQQQQRPWGSAEISLNGPYVGDETGVHLPVIATIKNSGATPAIGLEYGVELYIEERTNLPRDELLRFCKEIIARPAHGDALLTNGSIIQPWGLNLPKETIDKYAIPSTAPPFVKMMNLHVLVCVAYRSLRTKDIYYTGSIYKIVGDKPVIFYPGTMAADQLRLMVQPQLGSVIIH
jgi:hypothetical protein